MEEWINQDLIEPNSIGFIYKIEHKVTGEFYIGKKLLTTFKSHIVIGDTKRKKKVRVYSESKWREYFGSNKDFINYVKSQSKEMFTRTILIAPASPYELTYYEIHYQIMLNWLSPLCWNSNILGKFYKGKILKWEDINLQKNNI